MASKRKPIVAASAALAPLSAELQQRFAKYAEQDAASVAGVGWAFLGTRGGVFRANDAFLESPQRVIILGAVRENSYYDVPYDPDVEHPPVCFAVGRVGQGDENLAPPDELPTRQHTSCAGCPMNQYGSDAGRGAKACKNVMRLALLHAGDLEAGELSKAQGARLRVPVTSVRAFSNYVGVIARGLRRPLFSVVTDVHIEPDPANVFSIRFEPVQAIASPEILGVLEQRLAEVREILEALPPRDAVPVAVPRDRKPSRQANRQRALRETMAAAKRKGAGGGRARG